MLNYYEHAKAHPEYFKQFTAKELLCLKYDCPIEWVKADKWSEHNFLWFVLTGKKIIHTPYQSWVLERGGAYFFKKGAHISEQLFDEIFCIVAFFIPDSYIDHFVRQNASTLLKSHHPVSNDIVLPVEVNDIMLAFYESVIPYFHTDQKPSEDLLELKFRELLLNTISNPANKDILAYFQSLGSSSASELRQIMETNCLYNLSLEQYARLCNRSLSSFKRDFQRIYHQAPGRWLAEKKLMHAHHLLETTEKSVQEIAFECGFENHSHFSRIFKNRFQHAPLRFRQEIVLSSHLLNQ